MKFSIVTKSKVDLRIHKSYDFLENFYLKEYPRKRRFWAGVAISLALLNLWQIFSR